MKKILTLLFVIIGLTAFSQQNLTLKTLKVDTVRGRTNLRVYLKDTLIFKDGSKQWTAGGSGGGTAHQYLAGVGITLTNADTVINHTAHTGDATGATSITVVALRGRSIATTAPTSGNVLGWNGSYWIPTTASGHTILSDGVAVTPATYLNFTGNMISMTDEPDTTYISINQYNAGAGITINSGSHIISAINYDTLWNASRLRGKYISTVAPTNGQVLQYNSTTTQWIPTTPTGTTYSAGTGLTLTSSTFSVKPFDTSLTTRYWSDTFTVTRIDTNTIRFYVSSARALQIQRSLINHIIRWKPNNGTWDSIKCAVVNLITVSGGQVNIDLCGDHISANTRLTSFAYSLYEQTKILNWFVSGLQVADTSPVGIRYKLPTTNVTYRIICGKADLYTAGTSFVANIYWGGGITRNLFNYTNMLATTSCQGFVNNTWRTITGSDLFWLTLRTTAVGGSPANFQYKLYYIENSILSAQ